MSKVKIEIIDINSPHLPTIKRIGKANAQTLGFLPEGGFNERALSKQILAAVDENGDCVGYVLYRIAHRFAKVTHLCVPAEHRRNGIGRKLVEKLKEQTTDLLGISLRCRRDYEASKIWSKLGFIAISELKGRGKVPMDLTSWQYHHGHPDLFSQVVQDSLRDKLCIVIDANTFFDIDDPSREYYEESSSLRADWLAESVEICVVDEIYNEIDRNQDETKRKQSKAKVSNFTVLAHDSKKFDTVLKELRNIIRAKDKFSPRDESDLAQISKTICSPAKFFITRDRNLLNSSEKVEDKFNLKILRPVELITQLDELQRESEYEPARLSGTNLKIQLVNGKCQNELIQRFQLPQLGEGKSQFQQNLYRFLSKPTVCQTFYVVDDERPIALFVYDKTAANRLEIPMFRVSKSPISKTLVRHLILKFVSYSSAENKNQTLITDKFLTEEMILALEEEGFFKTELGYSKIHLPVALESHKFAAYLQQHKPETKEETAKISQVLDILSKETVEVSPQTFADIEKLFYPAKITDASLPCFIISIKPGWALELFDEMLANQTMYGAKSELALHNEQVYYRSTRNAGKLKAPGRILWYISKGSHLGSGAIRAYSTLDEILIDFPKKLYGKFKRLGIYDWKNIYEDLAKKNLENCVMALRFSNTELLQNPIECSELNKIINAHNGKINLLSPSLISAQAFADIYNRGVKR